MSDLWRVFSPLSFDEMSELEAECDRQVDAYLLRHPASKDTFGELAAQKGAPKEKEAKAAHDRIKAPFGAELKSALKACKSTLLIDRPGDLDRDPLQVSVLGWILARAKDALVAFEDAPYRPAKEVSAELEQKKAAKGFGETARTKEANGDSDDRAMDSVHQIVDTFEAAEHNLDLQIDLKRILGASSTLVKRYVTLLVSQGAVSDAAAAKGLGVPVAEVKKAREEVSAVTRAIRPPREAAFDAPLPGDMGEPDADD